MRLTKKAILAAALLAAAVSKADAQGAAARPSTTPSTTVAAAGTLARETDGEVADMYVKGDSLEVVFVNTGRKATDIIGAVQVRTLRDTEVTTVALAGATVSAGSRHVMRVAMPKLARGKYTLYAIVDFGGDGLTAAQAALEIK